MKKVVIGIGSNIAMRDRKVTDAIVWLRSVLDSVTASTVYPTLPEGKTLYSYANAVVAGLTDKSQAEIKAMLKDYEIAHGRTPRLKACDIVPVDLDLVVYGTDVLRPADFDASYFTIGYDQIKNSLIY